MKSKRVAASVIVAFGLAGCATSSPDDRSMVGFEIMRNLQAETIDQAVEVGNNFLNQYLAKAQEARQKRDWLNLAIWLGGTATTVTAGIGVDTETVFLISAATQSFNGLDPIINYGGVAAPGDAVASTRCVVRAGRVAQGTEVQAAFEGLKTYGSSAHQTTIRRFEMLPERMVDRYVGIYQTYLTATTAPLLDAPALPAKSTEEPANNAATPESPKPEQLAGWDTIVNAVAAVVEQEVSAC